MGRWTTNQKQQTAGRLLAPRLGKYSVGRQSTTILAVEKTNRNTLQQQQKVEVEIDTYRHQLDTAHAEQLSLQQQQLAAQPNSEQNSTAEPLGAELCCKQQATENAALQQQVQHFRRVRKAHKAVLADMKRQLLAMRFSDKEQKVSLYVLLSWLVRASLAV